MLPFVCIFGSQKLTCLNTPGILGTKKFRQIETKITIQPFEGLSDYR
jgi:hypothetical protein